MNEEKQNIPMKVSLLSSSLSGSMHILLGYPFDTIKTLRQSGSYISIKDLGYKRLFKGIKYPLIQHSIINSTCFGLNNYFLNKMENKNMSHLLTAVTSTIILTPLDKFKIMSQYNSQYTISMKNIVNSYKNFHIVCACEIPSTFLYFLSYRKLKEYGFPIFISGGLAGMSSWIFTYPIDTIKTRMQNESCNSIKQAMKQGGLYNGLIICLFRSFFVNGVNFYCYDKICDLLKN
tara:strand:- start:2534 stop:3232 length:699 start_codon:yes stop_codon:yes gene_type:complete